MQVPEEIIKLRDEITALMKASGQDPSTVLSAVMSALTDYAADVNRAEDTAMTMGSLMFALSHKADMPLQLRQNVFQPHLDENSEEAAMVTSRVLMCCHAIADHGNWPMEAIIPAFSIFLANFAVKNDMEDQLINFMKFNQEKLEEGLAEKRAGTFQLSDLPKIVKH